MDADTFRYFGDRSAGIEDEANGLILVLLGEVTACRHAILPLASAAVYDRVSTRSGTVQATYDGAAELDEGLTIVLAGLRSQLRA